MRWTNRTLRFRGSRSRLRKARPGDDWSPQMWVFFVWVLLLLLLFVYIVLGK
jgi:hypothetical protein